MEEMKDISGAVIGALFPSSLGVIAFVEYREWFPGNPVQNAIANLVINLIALIGIAFVGVVCAFMGASLEHKVKKIIKWHGYRKGLRRASSQSLQQQ